MQEKYLSPKQASEKFGINVSSFYWWINQKMIIFTKVGKKVLIPEEELNIFLRKHTVKPSGLEDYEIPTE